MAYRRKQQVSSSPGFRFEEGEESRNRNPLHPPPSSSADDSLAAKAIRASSAHRDSSLSSAYAARGAQSASSLSHSAPQYSKSNPTTTATSLPSPTQVCSLF